MRIKYDRQELAFEYEGDYDILSPSTGAGDPIGAAQVVNALRQQPMADLFADAETVTIVLPDITRYAGAEIYLPPLIASLTDCGVPTSGITLLFATGTHRGHTPEEWRSIVGDAIPRGVRLLDHDAKGGDLVPLGMKLLGEEIRVNRAVVECDRLIVTGAVGLHYLAGFGGGRKTILPGVASYKDATRFHALSLNPDGPGRHPKIGPAILDGNPMSDMAFAAMELVHPALSINMVIDRYHRPVELFVGDPVAAYRQACDAASPHATATIEKLYDAVLVSCGGFPKDINFIQAHKSYDNGVRALKPGGKLFLVAACPDRIGNETFTRFVAMKDAAAIDAALRRDFQINGQTAMATREKSAAFDTLFLTDLDEETVRSLGMRKATSPDAFFAEVAEAFAQGDGLVIGEGGFLTPIFTSLGPEW